MTEFAIEIWERGRWRIYAVHRSFTFMLWWRDDMEYVQGGPARLVRWRQP